MESLLQVENLTKSYGDRLLFGDITFGVNEGDKIGIIAKNGTGKTTLLKILCNKEDYDSGNVTYRKDAKVGFLEQIPDLNPNQTVFEVCLSGYDKEKEEEWAFENRIKQTLSQLKITNFNQPVSELSGGQIKRVALAKLILDNCELLILDEPTNHLDLESIAWLETYLLNYSGTVVIVAHDRYFLNKIVSKVVEIEFGKATVFWRSTQRNMHSPVCASAVSVARS